MIEKLPQLINIRELQSTLMRLSVSLNSRNTVLLMLQE